MIPEKAIDEAWDKLHENPARPINITYSMLEAALEAAAPYMLAALAKKADDPTAEDMDKYFIDQADVGGWLRSHTNPYRSQA